MAPRPRLRALGVAAGMALVFLLATRQLGCNAYSVQNVYRQQVDAFLSGRLALDPGPSSLWHDLAWTPSGVQQVWGLGAPMWLTPFELLARAVGQGPFPERIALWFWLSLAFFVLLRTFRREDEPWWIGGGSVLIVGGLPAFVAMFYGRVHVYEETAAYAYTAAAILLGGVVAFARNPTRNRYLLLLLAAGLTGLIRPTVWFYGFGTAIIATAIYVRHAGRKTLPIIALGAALFVAGGAALYATNVARFGKGTEFGHSLNIASLPGNIYATRFSYPFQRVGLLEASVELLGGMFGRPETPVDGRFYEQGLHPGQSETVRWREYYFTTFSWPYVPLLLAGLVLGVHAWRKRRDERWLAIWAVIGAVPLFMFYLRSPSVSSRYQLDLAPAFAGLLVITWRFAAQWMIERKRGKLAPAILLALYVLTLATSQGRSRPLIGRIDRDSALQMRPYVKPVMRTELPPSYDLADPRLESYLDADGKPPELYINGSGWSRPSGRVAPAAIFYVSDPDFIELDIVPTTLEIRARLGLEHLPLVENVPIANGRRLRFAVPAGTRGLHVLFLAFGPDTELDRKRTAVTLRSIRWR